MKRFLTLLRKEPGQNTVDYIVSLVGLALCALLAVSLAVLIGSVVYKAAAWLF